MELTVNTVTSTGFVQEVALTATTVPLEGR